MFTATVGMLACYSHVGIPLLACCSHVGRGHSVFSQQFLTSVCVESADAGVFLRGVPQFHRAVGRAGKEAILDAAVSQSPHSVRVIQPRPCQDAGF